LRVKRTRKLAFTVLILCQVGSDYVLFYELKTGIRQGGVLSAVIFRVFILLIIR